MKTRGTMSIAAATSRALVVAALLPFFVLISEADATDDRFLDDPTDWWWCNNRTAAQIDSIVSANGARVVDIEIDTEFPLRFAAAFAQNTGPYERDWYWFFDQTPLSLAEHIVTTGGRLIDLERYITVDGTRFAALLTLDPAGQEPDDWWYFLDQTESQVSTLVAQHNMRLIDIESHQVESTRYYDVVGVQNTGTHAIDWWWLVETDTNALNAFVSAHDARVMDMDVVNEVSLTFDAILVDDTGEDERVWWWAWNLTKAQVRAMAEQNGARIIDLEPYYPSGFRRFAVLLIGNLNELEAWVAEALGYASDGVIGFYLKEVGGPVLAGLQETHVFEPASTIKVVHHLHAMREVDMGHASLSDVIQYTSNLSGSCPIWGPPWEYAPLSEVTTAMMRPSDNAATQGITMEYGESNIENTANLVVGMADTELNHTLGCGDEAVANPNRLTLYDVGLLYEGVAEGTLLSAPMVDTMRSLMVNEDAPSPWTFTNDLRTVVNQEAAALGIPQVATPYWEAVRLAWKPGGYNFYIAPSWEYHRSIAGWVSLPDFTGGPASEYVFGLFIKKAMTSDGSATSRMRLFSELFRHLIRDALEQCLILVSAPVAANTTLLGSVSPNPFASSTDMSFGLARAGAVNLSVYDVQGRRVAQLLDGWKPAGGHRLSWDGRSAKGTPVPAGVYFLRLVTEDGADSQKVTRLK